MTNARSDGLRLLVLGISAFVFFGAYLTFGAKDSLVDFKMLYYGSQALLQHIDPYNQQAFATLVRTGFGDSAFIEHHPSMTISINLPTTYSLILPLALLPFWLASAIWSIVSAASLITATCLIWRIGADYAPILSGALAGFALLNASVVLGNGNSAGIIVGLCVIAAWSFVTGRFVWLGVLFFAIGLIVKPQDAGLLWLFFLLAGGIYRKRSLQALALSIVLTLPTAFWASRSAPRWIPELHANLVGIAAHGGNCDPGPAGLTSTTGTMEVITDLQTAISVFRDSPSFYNPFTFLVCGIFVIVWALVTLKSGYSPTLAWIALAAIAPLTLLVTYHRAYDARLLLVAIPACAMLWAKDGAKGKIALVITFAALFFTGEIPLAFITPHAKHLHFAGAGFPDKLGLVLLARPTALSLVAMSLFYLWIYVREYRSAASPDLPAVADKA